MKSGSASLLEVLQLRREHMHLPDAAGQQSYQGN
jgi:hypothetical protein